MSKRLTEGDIKGMLQMSGDGVSMANIAKAYDCSVYTVFRHISAVNGVKQMKSFTLEEKQSAVNDWLSGRYTARQVATSHGIGVSTLEKWTRLHKAGKLNNIQVIHAGPPRKVTDDSLAVAVELYNKGHGIRIIAEHIGVSPDAVKRNLVRIGVYQGAERTKSTKGRKDKFSDDTKRSILTDYTDGNMTIAKLAEKYGASAPTITKILESFGVHHESTGRKGLSQDGTRYDTDQVIADYNTGLFSHGDLAKVFKVSTRTISRILDGAGIKADNSMKTVSADEVAKVIDEVKADIDEGMDVYTCAKKHSIPMHTVEKILDGRYNRLKVTRRGETVVNYYTPVKKEVRTEVVMTPDEKDSDNNDSEKKCRVAELHSQGLVLREIAIESGLTPYHVSKILDELGLELNTPADKHKDMVASLAKEGKSAKDIALEVGISVPTVRKLLDESGISLKDIARERKEDTPVEDKKGQRNDLVMKCVAEGLTVNEIAEKVGISIPTVRKVLADNGVELHRGKPVLQGSVEKCDETTVIRPEKCEAEHKKSNDGVDVVKARIVELYEYGREIADIAKELYLNVPIVSIEVNKAMKEGRLHRPFFTEHEKAIIKDMCNQWITPDKIAEKIGCDENMMRRYLQLPEKK